VTAIVSFVPARNAFLRKAVIDTVPPERLVSVTEARGHFRPLQVTFTVAPAGTPFTARLENVVDARFALMK
jgi:hypothetical protein